MAYLKSFAFLTLCMIKYASCEWFTSLSQMEDLVHIELDLLSSLQKYIEAEESKIQNIKRFANHYQELTENAQSNIDNYIGHPVNQYRLIKRLALEWNKIKNLVAKDISPVFLWNTPLTREQLPNEVDLKGIAHALMRLQDTYMLDIHDITQGVIKGHRANQPLTPDDCFYIGRTAYLEKDFYHCALWMTEASLLDETKYKLFSKFDALDHLSSCLTQQKNFRKAFDATVEMLQMNSSHDRILENYHYLRNILDGRKKGDDNKDVLLSNEVVSRKPGLERDEYERLCRLEKNTIPPKIEKRLKCYSWTNNNHPRLILQPVKLEEMWDSPHLVRFYDVVSNHEINIIKSIAKPLLKRSLIKESENGTLIALESRISKTAWLSSQSNNVVAKVDQRISDITGLSMETAEYLQVANYGVGGQFEPHLDFYKINDVDYGGNTVFTQTGVTVQPLKGSAAFWYNLFPSGAGDVRTEHAACPVLTGVKWVSNKWIHERDQEFRRKCQLKRNADNRLF